MKFAPLHRYLLLAALAGVAATGLAWSAIDLALGLGPLDEPGMQTAKIWLGRIHGASAMLALLALGSVLPLHFPAGWRTGARIRTGLGLLGAAAALSLTGYLLYYAVEDRARISDAYAHIAVGLGACILFGLHWTSRAKGDSRTIRDR